VDVTATNPNAVEAIIYPSAGVTGPYTLTATPAGGGSPVSVACAKTDCALTGLAPWTTYTVVVTGTDATSGLPTLPSPSASIKTPSAGAPALDVTVTGSGSVSVDISPSSSGTTGPYTLVATPIGGGQPITVTCWVPYDCSLTGLAPGTTYNVAGTATTSSGPTPYAARTTITMPAARLVGCDIAIQRIYRLY